MTQGTKHVEPETYAAGGKVDPAKLDALLDAGVSIIVSGLETRLRGLIALTITNRHRCALAGQCHRNRPPDAP